MLEPCERKWITSQKLHLSRQGLSLEDGTAYNHGFNSTNISQDKSDQSSHASHATSYYKRDDWNYRNHGNLEFQWQRPCKPQNLTVFISLFSFPFSNEPTFEAVEVPQPSYD
jgi:hypothetical protein